MSSSAYSSISPGCQVCDLGIVRMKCCSIGSASRKRPCSRRRQNICMPNAVTACASATRRPVSRAFAAQASASLKRPSPMAASASAHWAIALLYRDCDGPEQDTVQQPTQRRRVTVTDQVEREEPHQVLDER